MNIEEALKFATDTKACVIGDGVIVETPRVFKEQFPGAAKALLVADPRTWAATGAGVKALLEAEGIATREHILERGGASFHPEYKYVKEIEDAWRGEVMVAVGSGVINDLVKCAAGEMKSPYMVVATAASVDGYTSFGAAIVSPNGVKETYECPAPRAVVADVDVMLTAPKHMAAFGYADLLAKSPAGAEWILAAEIGATEWNEVGWRIVQESFREAVADAAGVANGDKKAFVKLTEGLMLSGFAMQYVGSSRPASGAEHRFSHILDMTHHTHNGRMCSHGEQVGVFTLWMTKYIEKLLSFDMQELDIEKCVANWPEWEPDGRQLALDVFAGTDFPELGVKEAVKKWQTKAELSETLKRAKERWPVIVSRIREQLIPSGELAAKLRDVGSAVSMADIGVADDFALRHLKYAMLMRFRYNVLDFAFRLGELETFA